MNTKTEGYKTFEDMLKAVDAIYVQLDKEVNLIDSIYNAYDIKKTLIMTTQYANNLGNLLDVLIRDNSTYNNPPWENK